MNVITKTVSCPVCVIGLLALLLSSVKVWDVCNITVNLDRTQKYDSNDLEYIKTNRETKAAATSMKYSLRTKYVEEELIKDNHYQSTSLNKKKRLEFVHITKCAGTAIEKAAAKAGISWGACHYLPYGYCKGAEQDKHSEYHLGSPWHDPEQKYSNAETFTVIRNPYSRALSIYYYTLRQRKTPDDVINTATRLNNYIMNELKKSKTNIPQSSYVFNNEGQKIIDHVLYFETLKTDGKFEELMEKFNLRNVTLPKHIINGRKKGSTLGLQHLHKHALQLINDYYHDDFINFRYQKLDKKAIDDVFLYDKGDQAEALLRK